MIKKVLFFAISIILAIVIYIIAFYTITYNHLFDIIESAIKEENYTEVTKIFTPFFDEKPAFSLSNEKYKVYMYEATIGYTKENEEKKTVSYFDHCYTVFMYGLENLEVNDVKVSDSETKNDTAFILSNSNGDTYTYKFVDSEANRNLVSSASSYGVVQLDFQEAIIKEKLNGEITNISFTESDGNVLFSQAVDLDFNSDFYTKTAELISTYDSCVETNDTTTFNKFYETWLTSFKETYQVGYTSSELRPSSNTWKIVGVMAVYLILDSVLGYFVLRRKRI